MLLCHIECFQTQTRIGRWGICILGNMVVILHQPDQVSKTETMASEIKVLFASTSDRLPVIQQRMEEPQTAFLA